jgi:hypothetical protein
MYALATRVLVAATSIYLQVVTGRRNLAAPGRVVERTASLEEDTTAAMLTTLLFVRALAFLRFGLTSVLDRRDCDVEAANVT